MTALSRDQVRINSLDQFRGYTVVGMFLVNFLGGYEIVPAILKHYHDYCSYADTIMPHFLFAVGFAFRLTFERRVRRDGSRAAYTRLVRRLLGLMLISVVIYSPDNLPDTWSEISENGLWAVLQSPLKRQWFQTLMHIAVTSLWIAPVIRASAGIRIAYALLSAAAHIALSSWFAFHWVNSPPNGIDGGPLAFLTWTTPAIVGTLACDAMTSSARPAAWRLFVGSIVLMVTAWMLSCGTRLYDVPQENLSGLTQSQLDAAKRDKLAERPVWPPDEQVQAARKRGWPLSLTAEPPFVPPPDAAHRKWNYWMMSQRSGTWSYLLFGAGISLAVFLGFYLVCDLWGYQSGFFRTFGVNALAGYVLHLLAMDAIHPFVPRDAPLWAVATAMVTFYAILWTFLRHLEKQKIFLRI